MRVRIVAVLVPTLAASLSVVAVRAAQQPEPALRFTAETTIQIGVKPVVVSVFNDGATALSAPAAAAALDPPPANPDGPLVDVPVEIDTGQGFVGDAAQASIPPGGRIRVRLVEPNAARPAATGWLTVTARSAAGTVVARRAIAVQPAALEPAVTSWRVTSVQWWPWEHDGGKIGSELPLETSCNGTDGPSTEVVDDDTAVPVSSTCSDGKIELRAADFPGTGTYTGQLEVGTTPVDLEVRRTMSVLWPVLLLLLGFVLALWTQGQLDRGSRVGQRLALIRLRRRARTADASYAEKADGTPWERYELERPVREAAASLSHEIDAIGSSLSRWVRWLPWPDGYMAAERERIRGRLAALEQLVLDWPILPNDLAAAHRELENRPDAIRDAPELVARALIILGAAGEQPLATSELQARRDEARALPAALVVVDELLRVRAFLAQFPDRPSPGWAPGDAAALVRARQDERQATAILREEADSTRVTAEVAPLVDRASRLASRLPKPEPPTKAGVSQAQPQTAAAVVEAPIVALERIRKAVGEAIRTGGLLTGSTVVIFLSLAIGVLTGLAALYNDKAWGTPSDYAAALVWGYLAATVISPIIAVVKQLGSRPSDAASTQAK